jgi:hypothetical protein
MAVAEVPFDLVGVKLAPPSARPGTVAKADAIGRLCASTLPFATVVAPWSSRVPRVGSAVGALERPQRSLSRPERRATRSSRASRR